MVNTRLRAAAVAALILIGITGCAPSDTEPAPAPTAESSAGQPPSGQTPSTPDATAPDATGTLDALQAVDAAVNAAGGVVVELGRDREDGREVWEVGVLRDDGSGIELYLDVETGEVVRERPLDLDSEQRTAPAVTASDAITTALNTVPGSVVELDLDTEGSRVVWEVQVDADEGGRFELYIDAATAEIVKQERDD